MDSNIKSDYFISENVSKINNSGLVWEDQKRKWESQLMYTTQQLAAQFTPWMPINNSYQHPGLINYTPVGFNWHSPQTISNNGCLVGTSEVLKPAKTQDFTPLPSSEVFKPAKIQDFTPLPSSEVFKPAKTQDFTPLPSSEVLKPAKIQDFTPLPSWHTPQTSNDDCCIGTSEKLKTAKTLEFTPPPPPNTAIKCYVCDEQVLRSEFALHLFFGDLKCNDCQIKVLDCKSFRSDHFRSSNCIHKHLSWSENPIEYLKSQLNVISKSDYKKVYRYVKRLKSLEQLLPWKSVFQEYRRLRKLDSYSQIKCEPVVCNTDKCEGKNINTKDDCDEVLLLESYDLDQMEDAVQVIDLVNHEMFQENYAVVKSESAITEDNHNIKAEQMINKELDSSHADNSNNTKLTDNSDINSGNLSIQGREESASSPADNSNKAKLTDNSDINSGSLSIQVSETNRIDNILKNASRAQSIKNALENILFKENLFNKKKSEKGVTSKQKQSKKGECNDKKTALNLTDSKSLKRKRKKYKKRVKIIEESVEDTLPMPMEPEIEFLSLPEDGNYLVTYTPIEECPMCYTKISLYNCTVNITLLLYTFWCQCGLKIFYLRKTPANIEHPVKIILNG